MKISTIRVVCSLAVALVVVLVASCSSRTDIASVPMYSESGNLNAIIENPAGTNHQLKYDSASNGFTDHGVIGFLPYPGNFGFIPGTYKSPADGGDGTGLDVMVLAESVEIGAVMEIVPVGMIQLLDGSEITQKVIAVPADANMRTIDASLYRELSAELIYILELWFQNHRGTGAMEIMGWKNETAALKEIQKWKRN